jgi:hypothetical protein
MTEERTIRVISSFVQRAKHWRSDTRRLNFAYRGERPWSARGEAKRVRQAAATAELWGLPVGVVTGERTEPAP